MSSAFLRCRGFSLGPAAWSSPQRRIITQAESYSGQSGITTEACSEGGQDVTSIQANDYIYFSNMDFGASGIQCFEARLNQRCLAVADQSLPASAAGPARGARPLRLHGHDRRFRPDRAGEFRPGRPGRAGLERPPHPRRHAGGSCLRRPAGAAVRQRPSGAGFRRLAGGPPRGPPPPDRPRSPPRWRWPWSGLRGRDARLCCWSSATYRRRTSTPRRWPSTHPPGRGVPGGGGRRPSGPGVPALETLARLLDVPYQRRDQLEGLAEVFGRLVRRGRGDGIHRGPTVLKAAAAVFDTGLETLEDVDAYIVSAARPGAGGAGTGRIPENIFYKVKRKRA